MFLTNCVVAEVLVLANPKTDTLHGKTKVIVYKSCCELLYQSMPLQNFYKKYNEISHGQLG